MNPFGTREKSIVILYQEVPVKGHFENIENGFWNKNYHMEAFMRF